MPRNYPSARQPRAAALSTAIFSPVAIVIACLALAAVAPPVAAASATAATATSAATRIEIRKFAFSPKDVTIAPGTTVVWTNRDETPHMVADRGKAFMSHGLDTGDRFSFTFTRPGDYSYLCNMHPFMAGVVHVRK